MGDRVDPVSLNRQPSAGGATTGSVLNARDVKAWQDAFEFVNEAHVKVLGFNATGMTVQRLTDEEMFLELKRAMNPLFRDEIAYHRPELSVGYRSPREQAANTHIEDDQETYIKIGGLLYSFLSLKDLPDATFPGILRELLGLDFPLVINTEVSIPDQAERLKLFKGRLRRMTAAQRDSKGGFKVNVDARVAEGQLMQTLQDLI